MSEDQNTQTYYSTVDRLSDRARASFGSVTDGSGILTLIVLLSGVLSAIFFWQNAGAVFANVWAPAALALALAVGLLPNEGAFFGWKRIRAAKHDMTDKQLKATSYGITAAVAGSIFGTFALFVISFPYVPAEIVAYREWLAFVALGLPIMVQVGLTAWYAVNERATVENFEYAKLAAMGFDAFIKSEQARMQSIIEGQARALDRRLTSYGREVGEEEAERLLNGGARELLNMGSRGPAPAQNTDQTRARRLAQDPEQFSLVDWAEAAANGHGNGRTNGTGANFTQRPDGR